MEQQQQHWVWGADCGLAGLMGCSVGGTWVCCVQGQVQEQFLCLSWHRAWCKKCSEPELALRRPISGGFGGMFALPEVLTHTICRGASGSTEDQRHYWLGLGSTLLSSRQALQNPSAIWALHPVRGGVHWSISGLVPPGHGLGFGLMLMPEALEAVLESRDVWGASPGPAGLGWNRSWQASDCLICVCVWSYAPQSAPQHLFQLFSLASLADEHLITPNNGDVSEAGLWGAWRMIRFTLSFRNSTAVSDSPLSAFSENCTSKALQMPISFSRMFSVWRTKLMKSLI